MKISDFKKLEKKINGYNFNQSYKNINIIMNSLSYFGNIASIFLAYFFMSKVLSVAITNNILIFFASIIILSGLELIKRDIFDKFSIQTLKDKTISKGVIPLLIVSFMLIFASFYSSLNGAKEFSSKSNQIDVEIKTLSNEYTDSLNAIYTSKIEIFEKQNSEIFEINKKLDEEARELPANWVNKKTEIRKQIDKNNEQIDKIDKKINELKLERDNQISKYEENIKKEGDSKKQENTKGSILFIILSTIIEFVILSGIYFNEYYKFRSYKEFRQKIEKDPNYQKWLLFDEILSVIIKDDTKMNEKLPSNKSIIEMCKVNDIIVLQKDVTNFLKIATSLNIIRSSGNVKYVTKTRDIAKEDLKKHFNID